MERINHFLVIPDDGIFPIIHFLSMQHVHIFHKILVKDWYDLTQCESNTDQENTALN